MNRIDQNAMAGEYPHIASQASEVSLLNCVELLEARRQTVCEEINACARPTAACDANFNALLAERSAIGLALAQLRPLCRGEVRIAHPRDDHSTKFINEVKEMSAHI